MKLEKDSKDTIAEIEQNELLRELKTRVKQVMEEHVTRRFVNETSSSVTTLCAAIEACLLHGLRRRSLLLFGSAESTFALLLKVSRTCPDAQFVVTHVLEAQRLDARNSAGSGMNFFSISRTSTSSTSSNTSETFSRQNSMPNGEANPAPASSTVRYFWLRVALFNKKLTSIIEAIAGSSKDFYDTTALLACPVKGGMVASLLAGPNALEYSRLRVSTEQYYSDPPAEELLQRHRLHRCSSGTMVANGSSGSPQNTTQQRPSMGVTKNRSWGPCDEDVKSLGRAREYVASLHQNQKASLLYGKNSIIVKHNEANQELKGYLSLHQCADSTLFIRWTPNELMHSASTKSESSSVSSMTTSDTAAATTPPSVSPAEKRCFWNYALAIKLQDVVYMHCHFEGAPSTGGGSLVLVGLDGAQHSPIIFPPGNHLLQFLTCLENGLLPWAQLEPPLWSHKARGKILPRLHRRSNLDLTQSELELEEAASPQRKISSGGTSIASTDDFPAQPSDYVFRIVSTARTDRASTLTKTAASSSVASLLNRRKLSGCSTPAAQLRPAQPLPSSKLLSLSSLSFGLMDRFSKTSPATTPPTSPKPPPSTSAVQQSSATAESVEDNNGSTVPLPSPGLTSTDQRVHFTTRCSSSDIDEENSTRHELSHQSSLAEACERMRRQLISRAFYGWLSHCRHIRTVRTHLSSLVQPKIVTADTPDDATTGLTESIWLSFLHHDGSIREPEELCRRVYFGGIEPSLRGTVWPFLLGVFEWNSTAEERVEYMNAETMSYDRCIKEWSDCERIIARREALALAEMQRQQARRHGPVKQQEEDGATTESQQQQQDDAPSISDSATGSSEPETSQQGDDDNHIPDEMLSAFATNLHRIEKDVHRCDRSYAFFTRQESLDKLKNIMCTYVWENIELGYIQGMCDLAAPLLVIYNDEVQTYVAFKKLMDKMEANFPHGNAMEIHLSNMSSLIQVLDPELFQLLQASGDYNHFYFCYRWFLLDFKREFVYKHIFLAWEMIWSARMIATHCFTLFIAFALVRNYRDIIIDRRMDFTDIIKFFNEMAEHHDAVEVLSHARLHLAELQTLLDTGDAGTFTRENSELCTPGADLPTCSTDADDDHDDLEPKISTDSGMEGDDAVVPCGGVAGATQTPATLLSAWRSDSRSDPDMTLASLSDENRTLTDDDVLAQCVERPPNKQMVAGSSPDTTLCESRTVPDTADQEWDSPSGDIFLHI